MTVCFYVIFYTLFYTGRSMNNNNKSIFYYIQFVFKIVYYNCKYDNMFYLVENFLNILYKIEKTYFYGEH